MSNKEKILKLSINYDDILLRMGANKHKTRVDDKIKISIIESIELTKKILQPKYTISFADKRIKNNEIFVEKLVINSQDILKLLKNSFTICGIVATVGKFIDERINLFIEEKKLTLAYIYDAIGSVAVEELVNNICNDIKLTQIKNNCTCTRRFSPGYGDWKIENQKHFLRWLGAEKIGVSLTEKYQMIPRKSVSAIFGIEKNIDK